MVDTNQLHPRTSSEYYEGRTARAMQVLADLILLSATSLAPSLSVAVHDIIFHVVRGDLREKFAAHSILDSSILRRFSEDIEPLVLATK